MNYLTNYYKNLCEQLQEKLNILEKQINEANIRNPELQFRAQFGDYNNPNRVPRHGGVASEDPVEGGAGTKRMHDMMKFQAAKAIAHPDEQESIEAVLTDMANTTPEAPGTAANAQHIRTALGAIKRLSGTEGFQTSLKNLQSKVDRKAADEVLGGDSPEHYYAGRLSREEDERFEDQRFLEAQKEVLGYAGPRKPK